MPLQSCKCGKRFKVTHPHQSECPKCGGRFRTVVLVDETVSRKWTGPLKRAPKVDGMARAVNSLDAASLWSVLAAVKAYPYPVGPPEPHYLKIRGSLKTTASQEAVTLGELRRFVLGRARGPTANYLQCAYGLQKVSYRLGGPSDGV